MILHDLIFPGSNELRHMQVCEGMIREISNDPGVFQVDGTEHHIRFKDAMILPGLINSHDHLDFNLFPAIGNRKYANYREWGRDIQSANIETIRQVRNVPIRLRTAWGMYKNLFNGFTTVVNHGDKLYVADEIIKVIQDHQILHSPGFEKAWKWKLNLPFNGQKYIVMHLGEGTDELASKEIDQVIRWNIFKRNIVAVHGVAMSEKQAASFKGLIWCPASNLFMLDETAAIEKLKQKTTVVFGTDSTLTAPWNAWEHFRIAEQTGLMTGEEILAALTTGPAVLWELEGHGSLTPGNRADLLVVRRMENFTALNPEDILLVVCDGDIRLFDQSLSSQINVTGDFCEVKFSGCSKYVVGNFTELLKEIRSYGIIPTGPFV
jgi:cytosine/adenosine deaminase-related metal-dependent hydrolase